MKNPPPHRLVYLNTSSPFGGAVWKVMEHSGVEPWLEEVCRQGEL